MIRTNVGFFFIGCVGAALVAVGLLLGVLSPGQVAIEQVWRGLVLIGIALLGVPRDGRP